MTPARFTRSRLTGSYQSFEILSLSATEAERHPDYETAAERLRSGLMYDPMATSPIVENRAYTLCYAGCSSPVQADDTPEFGSPMMAFLVRATRLPDAEARALAYIRMRWHFVTDIYCELHRGAHIRSARRIVKRGEADWLWPEQPGALEDLLLP